MPNATAPQYGFFVVALLGWGTYLIRSLDENHHVNEIGFLALSIAITSTVCLVLLVAIPGIAQAYGLGWSDRDRLGDRPSQNVDTIYRGR